MVKIYTELVETCETCPKSGRRYDMLKKKDMNYCWKYQQTIENIKIIAPWCKLEDAPRCKQEELIDDR